MTLANRAIGAPINIWNDHSDAMAVRDSGWVQLFAETNQEAADLPVQAFCLAEELSAPVMVSMDGFLLTHAVEQVDVPTQAAVDAFLPPYEPRQVLDPADPASIGAMVGPDAFEEVRYLVHLRQLQALDRIERIAERFAEAFGRRSGGLVTRYRSEDARVVVVALGSIVGTLKDVVDVLRERGERVGVIGVTTFRPFPHAAIAEATANAERVVVIEKALSPGVGGILSTDVLSAIAEGKHRVATVVAGLGGRAITERSLLVLLDDALAGRLEPLEFLDLDRGVAERQLARLADVRRSGAIPENILRDIGVTGFAPHLGLAQ
jgi:pyruvate ferredoxin oxidoreductase alpha subunit